MGTVVPDVVTYEYGDWGSGTSKVARAQAKSDWLIVRYVHGAPLASRVMSGYMVGKIGAPGARPARAALTAAYLAGNAARFAWAPA
jgi:hypothetical protein